VRAVESAGGPSIGGGLDAGLSVMSERASDRIARVLLLSDGQDNSGLPELTARARQIIARQGVLSTLGIGQDFDEQVMTSLSTAGTGAFYYMAKPEVLPAMLDAELKTATETYASGAELRLGLAEGVRVMSAGGIPVQTRGSEAIIPIGSLYAARERKLWLTLNVPTDTLLERELGKLQLSYRRDGTTFDVSAAPLQKVACVADQTSYETRINPAVWGRAMVEEELNRAREEIGDAIARGTAQDVDRSVARVESQRQLAERLGQKQVLAELVHVQQASVEAKVAQRAAPAVRSASAKTQKAIGYGKRNASSYGSSDYAAGF
jgi:Ca-activated chloride channel family protein